MKSLRFSLKDACLAFTAFTCMAAAQAPPGIAPGMPAPGIPAPGIPAPGIPSSGGYRILSPLVEPTLSPGQVQLAELEARFQESVKEGGGKAFATWFADDAVTLNNGKPAILGRGAIAATANWDPRQYQLTWALEGAQMGPSNDMGFTWGHYQGRSIDHNGQPILTGGRYITIWKKTPAGTWKVALDASADDAPNAGDCCALPKP